jgi:hypothetical protein
MYLFTLEDEDCAFLRNVGFSITSWRLVIYQNYGQRPLRKPKKSVWSPVDRRLNCSQSRWSVRWLATALLCSDWVLSRRRSVAAEIGYRIRANFLWRHQKFKVGGLHGFLFALGNRNSSVDVANWSRAGRPNVCGFIPLRGTKFFFPPNLPDLLCSQPVLQHCRYP